MRPGRGQRMATAWAVRGQPCPAMGTELPVRVDLAAAIAALVDQVAKLFLELQECGLLSARLGLGLLERFVHGVPSVFPRRGARVSRLIYAPTGDAFPPRLHTRRPPGYRV
jgi:hypothetical protein